MSFNFLKHLALRWGLIEEVSLNTQTIEPPWVICPGDTLTGVIETSRDVIVYGTVIGGIRSENGMVQIREGGCVRDGRVRAKKIVWQGLVGSGVLESQHLDVESSAQTISSDKSPTAHYENLEMGKAVRVNIRLAYQTYEVDSVVEPA